MAAARPSREGGFKFAHFRTKDVGAMIQHAGNAPVEIHTNAALLFGQIDEGEAHGVRIIIQCHDAGWVGGIGIINPPEG